MQRFKEKIRTSSKKLTKILLILLCFMLPSQIFYWTLCINEDRNIPENAEVIVSSCMRPIVRWVPGGEVLFVYEKYTYRMYLLDLHTGRKRWVFDYALLLDKGIFLSSELVWLRGSLVGPDHPAYRPPYILDLTDGQRYELLTLKLPPRLQDGNFNPDNYSYIQFADHVFVDLSGHRLIALSANFRANQSERVILDRFSGDDDEFLDLVKSFRVEYENVDSSLSGPDSNVSSPSGKLFVKNGGIYLSNTNTLFEAIPYSYYFRGWYYDDSGVVIHDDYGTYWLQPRYLGEYGLDIYHLSRPVLKLRLAAP